MTKSQSGTARTIPNRALGAADLEIEGANAKFVIDANHSIGLFARMHLEQTGRVVDDKLKDYTEETYPLLMSAEPVPGVMSSLSGQPGLIYRTMDVGLALTRDEIKRLVLRSLEPDEVRKIGDLHGTIYEIEGCFYDPETGEAVNPVFVD